MIVKGTFDVTMTADPPHDEVDGVTLSRARVDKRFSGPLEATSQVNMLAARTPVEGSAGYVGLERVTGALDGKHGSFVLLHLGAVSKKDRLHTVVVVPDSGTGELRGISGRMIIEITGGQHFYELDYELAG